MGFWCVGFSAQGLRARDFIWFFNQKNTGNGDEGRMSEVKEKVRMTSIGLF